MTTVSAALSASTHVLTLLRGISDQAKASGKSELLGGLIDLQLSMMQLLQQQQQIIEENAKLKSRVRELEQKQEQEGTIEYHCGVYWKRLEGVRLDGPYSTHEWDINRRLVRLQVINSGKYSSGHCGYYVCATTKHNVFVPVSFLREHEVPVPPQS